MKIPDFIQNDEFLYQYLDYYQQIINKTEILNTEFAGQPGNLLSDYTNGYLFFGVHLSNDNTTNKNYVFREWAPNATAIYLLCEASSWSKNESFKFHQTQKGIWEFQLGSDLIGHKSLYKLLMEWENGSGERVSAWSRRVVQDENTLLFASQVWMPEYDFSWKNYPPKWPETPLIYETHVGMALEDGRVGNYKEFKEWILPMIYNAGYNVIQLMAVQEHPYYGSFGYHVSSFFAVCSRMGTPDELKELIDAAHGLGMCVIMDIVHSHAVKNESEGISRYDGTYYQFFHDGERGNHPAWDSRCFDYSQPQVIHFLLSNSKFWIEEYRFNGYRFDGVTSMLFKDHGLGRNFLNYSDYFNDNLDIDSLAYLRLMNKVVHEVCPNAITIAEDMCGFPGLCVPVKDGGIGFDYRMSMGVPDYWIDTIKNIPDQLWHVGDMFHRLTDKRTDEKVVSYVECHDQALVGDQTIIFRLIGADMYLHMNLQYRHLIVDRGMALHKMIRLATLSMSGGAYLNFMGNEFGHPEWIDFPREGNNWSFHYARRQWHLAFDKNLRYQFLYMFDKQMLYIAKKFKIFNHQISDISINPNDQILGFKRGNLFFAFNFSPDTSYESYGFKVDDIMPYSIVLNTDSIVFDGFDRIDNEINYKPLSNDKGNFLMLYLPARTAIVLSNKKI